MIDWTRVQRALTRDAYDAGPVDGQPGSRTWIALIAYAAGNPAATDAIRAIGGAAAKWLTPPGHPDPVALTPQRLAEFLAQTSHETGGYTRFEEDLRYSVAALMSCWPARFPSTTAAKAVAGRPQAIAEACYGGRMGNTTPGDGWRFRGRGMLQLTGRANYVLYGKAVGLDLVREPDLAADPADSLVIAAAYWRAKGVNAAVDRGDFTEARRLTNGGRIGLEDVAVRRERLLGVLM